MADLDALVKDTVKTMGRCIQKPPMAPKLLVKPPFRFLHDVVTEVSFSTTTHLPQSDDRGELQVQPSKELVLMEEPRKYCEARNKRKKSKISNNSGAWRRRQRRQQQLCYVVQTEARRSYTERELRLGKRRGIVCERERVPIERQGEILQVGLELFGPLPRNGANAKLR